MGIKQKAQTREQPGFEEAIELVKTGQSIKAYPVFVRLHYSNPGDPNLLLWIALTSPDPAEARRALEHSRWLDPSNPAVIKVQLALLEREVNSSTSSPSRGTETRGFSFPEAAEVYRDLSLIYRELGDSSKARFFQSRATWLKRA